MFPPPFSENNQNRSYSFALKINEPVKPHESLSLLCLRYLWIRSRRTYEPPSSTQTDTYSSVLNRTFIPRYFSILRVSACSRRELGPAQRAGRAPVPKESEETPGVVFVHRNIDRWPSLGVHHVRTLRACTPDLSTDGVNSVALDKGAEKRRRGR